MREPQGVASLALGYVLHWAFSPPLLNPKLESLSHGRSAVCIVLHPCKIVIKVCKDIYSYYAS